jgi:hypothetical protein
MGRKRVLVISLGVLTTVSACGGSPPAQPGPAQTAPVAAAGPAKPTTADAAAAAAAKTLANQTQATAAAAKAVTSAVLPPQPMYEAKGRRDPFQNLEAETKKAEQTGGLAVAATRLAGIVRSGTTMALVEAPDGVGYILKPGDVLGDGRLLEIGQDTAIFIVQPRPGSTVNRVVLKLKAD